MAWRDTEHEEKTCVDDRYGRKVGMSVACCWTVRWLEDMDVRWEWAMSGCKGERTPALWQELSRKDSTESQKKIQVRDMTSL